MIGFCICILTIFSLVAPGVPIAGIYGHDVLSYGRMNKVEPMVASAAVGTDTVNIDSLRSLRLDFKLGAVGYYKDTTITIANNSGSNLIDPQCSILGGRHFRVASTAVSIISPDSAFTVAISYRPMDFGPHIDTLLVGWAGEMHAIPLSGRAIPTILPFDDASTFDAVDTVDLGAHETGYRDVDTATIIGARTSDTLRIEAMAFDSAAGPFTLIQPSSFPVVIVRPPTDTTVTRPVIVGITEGVPPGVYSTWLVIRANVGTLRIRFIATIRARAVDTGAVGAYPGSLKFGEVPQDTCRVDTLWLRNARMVPAQVNLLLDGQGVFTLISPRELSISIPPNDSAIVLVRFCPTDTGRFNGAIVISGDLEQTIYLSGSSTGRYFESVPDSLYIGRTDVGTCTGDTVIVVPFRVGQWVDSLKSGNPAFQIVTNPALPAYLSVGDTLRIQIRFCAQTSGMASDSIFLRVGQDSQWVYLARVHGSGLSGGPGPGNAFLRFRNLADTTIDFGAVDTLSCATYDLVIENVGDALGVLDELFFDPSGAGTPFGFALPLPALPLLIPAGESRTIALQFCPKSLGGASAMWNAQQSGGRLLQAVLRGSGVAPAIGIEHTVRLADTTVRVGETFRLMMRIDAPVGNASAATFESARIILNRRSLWLKGVFPASAPGVTLAWGFEDDSTVLVTGTGGTLSGGGILELELVGLSTGMTMNHLRIEELTLGNLPGVTVDTSGGEVVLLGCDIGRQLGYTRKIAIKAIRLDPLSSAVAVSYDAPEGLIPSASLIDMTGGTVLSRELPYGNGKEQEARIALGDLAPGVYLLELRVGKDRSTVPIMLSR